MHILMIPSAYPTSDAPLKSIFVKEQAIALKKSGYNVGIIYSETRRITGISPKMLKLNHCQIENINEDGINTIRLHGWNFFMMRNSFGINNWVRQGLKLFRIYIEKYGVPDILHAQCGLYGGMLAREIKKRYNIPYVLTEHFSIVMNDAINDYQRGILKSVYNYADALFSVGTRLRTSMMNYTQNDVKLIPNIVDTSCFSNNNNRCDEEFNFISVCLLSKNKNVDSTIIAFANNFKGNDKFKLTIIGSGSEENNLKSLVENLDIQNQVEFLGAINRENLNEYLNKSHCFVLPSSFETFGIAYIEALSCGLPIIATKCGGPEDFFIEAFGYMIPVNDIKALEEAMWKIVKNIDKYNRDEISDYIRNKFSSEVFVKNIITEYNNIIYKSEDGN